MRSSLVAVALLAMSSTVLADGGAEFAIRWDPAKGGPQTLDETLKTLHIQGAKSKRFDVAYLSVESSIKLPDGYAVIGREQSESGQIEATYKIRGPEPLPDSLVGWNCPLKGSDKGKTEVDITWIDAATIKRSISMSCSVEAATLSSVLPVGYVATPVGCTSVMERRKKDLVTVERWTLPQGRVMLEASLKGMDTPVVRDVFKEEVVKPLLAGGALPQNESKTELGSEC